MWALIPAFTSSVRGRSVDRALTFRSSHASMWRLPPTDMNRNFRLLLPTIAFVVLPHSGGAQTSQKLSIQGSGLSAQLYGDAFADIKNGIGGELQLRYTPGKWSFGGGFQMTSHDVSENVSEVFDKVKITGFFFEPRFVIDVGSSRYAPYLSGRFALSKMKFVLQDDVLPQGFSSELGEPTGPTINGGGGILFRLGSRANLDLGVTFGYTKFDNIRLQINDDGGTTVFDETFEVGSGTNAVFRLGLAFGLGG